MLGCLVSTRVLCAPARSTVDRMRESIVHHVARDQVSYFASRARPEGPKPEVQRADSAGGVLGQKAVSPLLTSYGVWGAL